MKTNPSDARCRYVVCIDGRSIWYEGRDFETYPILPAATNVVAGFTARREAERAVRQWTRRELEFDRCEAGGEPSK